MSVVLALISRRDAVTASDGRLFGSVFLQDGRPTHDVPVDREDFDKTFSLCQGRIVGAFAGLMRFGGQTIGEHVAEIVGKETPYPGALSDVVMLLEDALVQRLRAIPPTEVAFSRRTVDILLAGPKDLKRQRCHIARLRFSADTASQAIAIEKEVLQCRRGFALTYAARGEERASAAVSRRMKANRSPRHGLDFMKSLAAEAIRLGIAGSGKHRDGDVVACGGHVFVRAAGY